MFGLRYHVASLAAVFVALAVGILLGVAVSGKVTDVGEDAELQNLRDDNEQLRQSLEAAQAAADAAAARGEGADELFAEAYPALMERRLEGESVAVVFLGPSDGSMRAEVEDVLSDAGAGTPSRVVALDVPVDQGDLASTLEGDELLASFADEEGDFSDLGRELGRQLVEGEDAVWASLQSELVEEQTGSTSTPVDAVVVVASWQPPEDADEEGAAQAAVTASLLEGFVGGLDSAGVPVVGVAAADDPTDDPTQVLETYRDRGISSVDAVDVPAGRLALALLLAGAEPGHYGFGETATDGIVPPIEPVPVDQGE